MLPVLCVLCYDEYLRRYKRVSQMPVDSYLRKLRTLASTSQFGVRARARSNSTASSPRAIFDGASLYSMSMNSCARVDCSTSGCCATMVGSRAFCYTARLAPPRGLAMNASDTSNSSNTESSTDAGVAFSSWDTLVSSVLEI